MEFLYPTQRQFPFDAVCAEIVAALEVRNFDVPRLKVEVETYGSGAQWMRYVNTIESDDVRIHFCRVQRLLPGGRFNDVAGVHSIAIPRKGICVYQDESGPTFWLYVGDDWAAHRESFLRGPGVNSKLRGEPRTYLLYKGSCNCRVTRYEHTHGGRRSPILKQDNDLGREYGAQGDEPQALVTADVLEEFRAYLQDVLLPRILAHPPAEARVGPLAEPTPTPWPADVGPLFCLGEHRDAHRIQTGQARLEDLPLHERFGMAGSPRLLPTDVSNDGTVPPVAYDGFLWCGLGTVTPSDRARDLRIPGYTGRLYDHVVIRVTPKTADGVYVADHAPYDQRRKEISDEIEATAKTKGDKPRAQYTGAEIGDFLRARARTIVPIAEYRGGFLEPVVLIQRELGLDEVEVVREDPG